MHEFPKFLKDTKLDSIYNFSGNSWCPTNKNYTEILFVNQGNSQCIFKESIQTLNAGNMIILFPSENTEISLVSNQDFSASVIVVKDFHIQYLNIINLSELLILSFEDNFNTIENHLSEIKEEIENPTFGSEE
ncbi:hypothetical protein, partial [Peribacillus frigoritolerans]|uniref:hypothetical protein n=1 Tax=Peribacillus frigoritolerans TaxID=450367 RepID=UPI002416D93A